MHARHHRQRAALLVAVSALALLAGTPHHSEGGTRTSWNTTLNTDDGSKEFGFVLSDPVEHTVLANGTSKDLEDARELLSSASSAYLWLRNGNKRYVIEDAAAIERARGILEPQIELGKVQSQLGDLQADLGDEQAKLGDEQARLGDAQARLGDRQAELADRAQDATREGGAEQRAWHKEMAELSNDQAELGRRQASLGQKQARLGRDQAKLGQEQARFGEQQAEVSRKARKEMKALLGESVKSGTARAL